MLARFLQLSWLAPVFSMFNVSPLHDPTPFPLAIDPGVLEVPVMLKSACVQAGLVPSGCVLNACTAAVTAVSDPSKRFHVFVKSDPSGADIFIDGEVVGATPVTMPIDLNGKSAVKLILRKEGYEDYEQRVINEMPLSINLKAKVVDPPPKTEDLKASAPKGNEKNVEEPPAPTGLPPGAAPSDETEKAGGRVHHHGSASPSKKTHGHAAAPPDDTESP